MVTALSTVAQIRLGNAVCRCGCPDTAPPLGRNLGDDLLPESLRGHPNPTETNTLTCANVSIGRHRPCVPFVRDEEVVGSNPATPTAKTAGEAPTDCGRCLTCLFLRV